MGETRNKHIRKISFGRIPETCDQLRAILDQCGRDIQTETGWPSHSYAAIDTHISRAFIRIRDEITEVFRKDHLALVGDVLDGCGTDSEDLHWFPLEDNESGT